MIVTAIVSAFVLPSVKELTLFDGSFFQLMRSAGCLIMYLIVIGSSMALSATDPLFSPYMSQTVSLNSIIYSFNVVMLSLQLLVSS